MAKNQPLKTLDLHGRKTDEVFDLVDNFLQKQSKTNSRRTRIMPGKGSGKIKSVLIDYLKKAGYPWEYEKINNIVNEGVILVIMD